MNEMHEVKIIPDEEVVLTKKKTEKDIKRKKKTVMVSVLRYKDNIVSFLGIPTVSAWVIHVIDKSDLKPDELFDIATYLTNNCKNDKDFQRTVSQILDSSYENFSFPELRVKEIKNMGNLTHDILNVEIEIGYK